MKQSPLEYDLLAPLIEERTRANLAFFTAEAERLAQLCHVVAERFSSGGRLVACGLSPAARSDVRHVAVEFVHPVIVGKRALPALGLTPDGGPVSLQADLLVEPADMLIVFAGATDDASARDEIRRTVAGARDRGALTIAFAALGAEWEFPPPTSDPFVQQELIETLYHVLWELVHVFFEHRGLLARRSERTAHDVGGSSFLYPFLAEQERDLGSVLHDVRRSILMKADEVAQLRRVMLERAGDSLLRAAADVRIALETGGVVHAFGNGGSATDAMDLVADLRAAPQGWPARKAMDLTEDAAILSAISNDVGADAIFARQVIAYGRAGDVAVGFSTSGNSRNVVQALGEARHRRLHTIAFTGYDGGVIAAEGLADTVIIAPSQHIPRIQEAHATGYHLLRALMEHP